MKKILIILAIISLEFLFGLASTTNSNKLGTTKKTPKNMKNAMMKDLYSVSSLSELTKLGINIPYKPQPMNIMSRSGLNINNPFKSALTSPDIIDATPGKCDPKPVCISNPLTANLSSNQLPFPPCINIHRCDGCCPTNEKCVAIKSHDVKLRQVGIITFVGENQGKYDEQLVNVANHTECQCQCQWETDDDCRKLNKNFIKSKHECLCECPEELSCDAFHEFDTDSCSCKCRKDRYLRLEQNCKLKGFSWNDSDCRCEVSKPSLSQKEIKIYNNNNQ